MAWVSLLANPFVQFFIGGYKGDSLPGQGIYPSRINWIGLQESSYLPLDLGAVQRKFFAKYCWIRAYYVTQAAGPLELSGRKYSKFAQGKTMRKIVAVIEKLTDIASGYLPAITVFVLMVMVLVEVITRYVMRSPLSIADELGGYMLVGITFVGLGYTWKERGHVSVELVTNLLSPQLRQKLRFITLLIATIFCYPLIAGSYELLQDSLLFGSRSGSWMRTPLLYPQSLLLVGSILLLLQLLAEIIKALFQFTDNSREEH